MTLKILSFNSLVNGCLMSLALLAMMRKVPAVCAQIVHNFVYGPYILCTICAQTAGTLRMICAQLMRKLSANFAYDFQIDFMAYLTFSTYESFLSNGNATFYFNVDKAKVFELKFSFLEF